MPDQTPKTEPAVITSAEAPPINVAVTPTVVESLYGKDEPAEAAAPAESSIATGKDAEPVPTPTEEAKPDEAVAPAEAAAEAVPAKPEDYKFDIPAGMVADEALSADFRKLAAEAKLPLEAAQPLVDFFSKALGAQVKTLEDKGYLATPAVQQRWLAEINALPEFQGERRTQSLDIIGRVMDEFATPAFKQMLDRSGWGNNPEMAKFILQMADLLVEGTIPPPGRPVGQQNSGRKTLQSILYESGGPGSVPPN